MSEETEPTHLDKVKIGIAIESRMLDALGTSRVAIAAYLESLNDRSDPREMEWATTAALNSARAIQHTATILATLTVDYRRLTATPAETPAPAPTPAAPSAPALTLVKEAPSEVDPGLRARTPNPESTEPPTEAEKAKALSDAVAKLRKARGEVK